MDILALDISSSTGYAFNRGGLFQAGTWKLSTKTEVAAWGKVRLTRRKDPRIERLCKHVATLGQFDVLIWEDVTFQSTTWQTQLWSSLRTAVWLCGLAQHFECVPVQTLKKFATGKGGADKAGMSAALEREHPQLWARYGADDDTVDAIWIHLWAQKNLQRMVPLKNNIGPHHD